MIDQNVPGWEGSTGPLPSQYKQPHVYARDTFSGAGNCICGAGLPDERHVQAAPGVPIPALLLRDRPAHLAHQTTERGFSHLPPIPSTHGGEISAYESSSATEASVWVRIEEKMHGKDPVDAVVHLTLEDTVKLRDQLDWLIVNHYWNR